MPDQTINVPVTIDGKEHLLPVRVRCCAWCGKVFVPKRKNHRFHSLDCLEKAKQKGLATMEKEP